MQLQIKKAYLGNFIYIIQLSYVGSQNNESSKCKFLQIVAEIYYQQKGENNPKKHCPRLGIILSYLDIVF